MRALALTLAFACGCATYTVDARTLEGARRFSDENHRRVAIAARADRDARATWLRFDYVAPMRPANVPRPRVRVRSPALVWGVLLIVTGVALMAGAIPSSYDATHCTQFVCSIRDWFVAVPLWSVGGTSVLAGIGLLILDARLRREVERGRAGWIYLGP